MKNRKGFVIMVSLLMALCMLCLPGAGAESSASAAEATVGEAVSAESSAASTDAGSGGASAASGAASAGTGSTGAETSAASTGTGDGGASASGAAASASTEHTSAEASSVSTSAGGSGAGSSSSSSSSTTSTTTTTTTTTTSSSSTSTSAGGASSSAAGASAGGSSSSASSSSSSSSSSGKSGGKSGGKSSGKYHPVEPIIRYTEVRGRGWTMISKVNVRTLASVYSKWVTQIRAAGTEVEVTAEVMNSRGEIWYAVKLYQGYVGYIRGDLLRVDIEPVEKAEAEQVVIQTVKQKTSQSPKVIYIVVQSDEPVSDADSETEIIYITPEQAAELGIG